ncbi:hypothetical protein [Streptomyces sp. NPDC003435]
MSAAGLRSPFKWLDHNKTGVRCVGVDSSETGRRDGWPAMLREIGVLDEDLEWVLVRSAAMEGLQGSYALGNGSTGLQSWKCTSPTVIEPGLEVGRARAGRHLDAARFLSRQGPCEKVFHLGVHGVLERSAELSESVCDEARNRFRQRSNRGHDHMCLITVNDGLQREGILGGGVGVDHPYDTVKCLIDVGQCRRNV